MDLKKLVRDYISLWNRRDVDGLLRLMHKGVAFYDAFWMESCAGRDASEYLRDRFSEEHYWYQQIGNIIPFDHGVAFRYNAHELTDSTIGRVLFNGAEVLNLRDDMIITVSDFYCDPDRTAIEGVANLTAKRHGLPKYVKSGLGTVKVSRYKSRLSALMNHERVYLDPDLTLSQLADQIGCLVSHISQLIENEIGTSFENYLNKHRARFAKQLLMEESDDPDYVSGVAEKAGFRTYRHFCNSFDEIYGVTPVDFHRDTSKKCDPPDGSNLH